MNDNFTYARLVKFIGNKSTLSDDKLAEIEEITMDDQQARTVLEAAKISMGDFFVFFFVCLFVCNPW